MADATSPNDRLRHRCYIEFRKAKTLDREMNSEETIDTTNLVYVDA
jgi:hypothetical protein